MPKNLLEILERLSTHAPGVCMLGGLVFVFLGVFDVGDFKSLTLRPLPALLPIALGSALLIAGILLHIFERPAKGLAKGFKAFYEARAADLSPPNLLLLAVAGYFTFPVTHGEQVARLNPAWRHDQGEWEKRSAVMDTLGLLNRNSSREVVRSDLGTAIAYLALKDPRFADVATIIKSDRELAKEWGL